MRTEGAQSTAAMQTAAKNDRVQRPIADRDSAEPFGSLLLSAVSTQPDHLRPTAAKDESDPRPGSVVEDEADKHRADHSPDEDDDSARDAPSEDGVVPIERTPIGWDSNLPVVASDSNAPVVGWDSTPRRSDRTATPRSPAGTATSRPSHRTATSPPSGGTAMPRPSRRTATSPPSGGTAMPRPSLRTAPPPPALGSHNNSSPLAGWNSNFAADASDSNPATVDSAADAQPTAAVDGVISPQTLKSIPETVIASANAPASGDRSIGVEVVACVSSPAGSFEEAATNARSNPPDDSAVPAALKVHKIADGLASRPASLLAPQAVLATSPEQPGATGSPPPPSTAPVTTGAPAALSEIAGKAAAPAQDPAEPSRSVAQPTATPTPDASVPASPVAVSATASTSDTSDGDLLQRGQGSASAALIHASLGTRESGGEPALAGKPVPVQVAVGIGKAAKAGLSRIEIALEPASLGRVEVRLDFARNGQVSALFVADNREALDLLRGDVRTLERALSEAGVKSDPGSLGFSLREDGAGTGSQYSGDGTGTERRRAFPAPADGHSGVAPTTDSVSPSSDRRLDIRA